MIIDWQHHITPEEVIDKMGGQKLEAGQIEYDDRGRALVHRGEGGLGQYLPEEYQLDKHLEWMDAAGIDIAVLTADEYYTVEDCKIADDALGNAIKKYPNRLVGLAKCMPTIGDESLKELDRAINVVGLRGVCIDAQTQGHNLDSDMLWPFYDMVSRLDIPIFVHISGTMEGYEAFEAKYDLVGTLGFLALDLNATARIILGGVLARFPDLKFVIAHLGGGISAIKERFTRFTDADGPAFWTDYGGTPPFDEPFGESFTEYFNKLYFDMAGYEGGMNAVKCALTTIKPERLLFATDYPPNFTYAPPKVREYIENIRKLDLSSESIELILGGTAAKLLKL